MRKLFCGTVFSTTGSDLTALLLRLTAGGMMLSHGIAKIAGFSSGYETFPDVIGIGGGLSFVLMMLTESLGSLLVIAGLLTRLASAALVFGMGVAAFVAHAPVTFSGSELPLLYLAAFLSIMIGGAGKYSLDRRICKQAD